MWRHGALSYGHANDRLLQNGKRFLINVSFLGINTHDLHFLYCILLSSSHRSDLSSRRLRRHHVKSQVNVVE